MAEMSLLPYSNTAVKKLRNTYYMSQNRDQKTQIEVVGTTEILLKQEQ